MKQTKLLEYLDDGATISLKLTGVSFGNCQNIIQSMILNNQQSIEFHAEEDNPYDKFALAVENGLVSEKIGYIPKQTTIVLNLPNRRRPLPVASVENSNGEIMQTNEVFYELAKSQKLKGEVASFLNFGSRKDIPIGVRIIFWKK